MRSEIIVAAALVLMSANRAHAEEWCGYAGRDNALIECGYTTIAGCESAMGKGGMCFLDPDVALRRRFTPIFAGRSPTRHG